ncbi:MAG: YraN family protein [Bacteroidetes bacterium]|nr:YraN family protein [Bacteroidota bacterium]MBU2584964.1 YraN family protein [Bacteroidota bacterium]
MNEEANKTHSNSKSYGRTGEDLAEKLLIKAGFKIIKRNFRFGKGEIDIVAMDGNCLVFVEVKYRRNLDFGEPEYSITKSKIRQLKRIAEAYYYINKIEDQECRFDVITILGDLKSNPKINHIKNAFY